MPHYLSAKRDWIARFEERLLKLHYTLAPENVVVERWRGSVCVHRMFCVVLRFMAFVVNDS